tara:strand:+ start:630 stop:839 length:210 start_codon:yes stop_codon:yes gene_type:complete
MIMNEIKEYPAEETLEFEHEGEVYDQENPTDNIKTLITRAVIIGLWTITGVIFMIFVSSPVVFHYWINH